MCRTRTRIGFGSTERGLAAWIGVKLLERVGNMIGLSNAGDQDARDCLYAHLLPAACSFAHLIPTVDFASCSTQANSRSSRDWIGGAISPNADGFPTASQSDAKTRQLLLMRS